MNKVNVKLNKKTLILSAAMDEIADKGYHKTAVEDIARRAGVAKGTVYLYFKTKEELFHVLIDNTFNEMAGFIVTAGKYPGRVRDKLRKMLELQSEYVQANRKALNMITREIQNMDMSVGKNHVQIMRKRFTAIFDNIGGIIEKEMVENTVITPKNAAILFLAIVQAMIFSKVGTANIGLKNKEIEIILNIYFNGISKYMKNLGE